MFAVEYSPSQNCFHIQPFEESVAKNFNSFIFQSGQMNDYVILHLSESFEDASRICNLLMDFRDLKIRGLTV